MPPIRSELEAWQHVENIMVQLVALGKKIANSGDTRGDSVRVFAANVMSVAGKMMNQLDEGMHVNPARSFRRNPALVVWPNPPHDIVLGKRFSDRVYEIRYKHRDDSLDYKHTFKAGVELWKANVGGNNAVIIIGAHGQNITEEF